MYIILRPAYLRRMETRICSSPLHAAMSIYRYRIVGRKTSGSGERCLWQHCDMRPGISKQNYGISLVIISSANWYRCTNCLYGISASSFRMQSPASGPSTQLTHTGICCRQIAVLLPYSPEVMLQDLYTHSPIAASGKC